MSNNQLADKLKGHIPDFVRAQLTQVGFDDLNPLELAHFLAQCDHESGGFRRVKENLNYSAAGLLRVFGRRFAGVAKQYARQPTKIANRAYANRLGNGDEASGDGSKFLGRSYIQLTGRDNYRQAGIGLNRDFIGNPDLVAECYPLATALWFFAHNKIFSECNAPTEQAVKDVTRAVNGAALAGLDERIKLFNKYWSILK